MGEHFGHHAASVAFGYAVHGQRAHTPAAQSRGSCPPQAPCCGPRDRHQRYHPFLRQCSPGSLPRLSRFTQSLQVVPEVLRRPNPLVWCRLPNLRVHWWRRPSRSSLEPPLHEHSCCRSRCHDRRLGAPFLRGVIPNPRHDRHQPQVPQLEPGARRPRPVHLIHQSCHTWFRSRQYSSAPTESVSCHQQILTFGGSYPGNLAAWFKLKYPALTVGSVASSAPVFAEYNYEQYAQVVGDALGNPGIGGSKECASLLTQGVEAFAKGIHIGGCDVIGVTKPDGCPCSHKWDCTTPTCSAAAGQPPGSPTCGGIAPVPHALRPCTAPNS